MRMLTLVALAGTLAACDALPRDAAGTSDRIAATHALRVGITAAGAADAATGRLVAALGRQTQAIPTLSRGEQEPLLVAIEAGTLDLALGWFDEDTPWASRVALGPPLATRPLGRHRLQLRAAARNGENRWIMLVEGTSRSTSPQAAR